MKLLTQAPSGARRQGAFICPVCTQRFMLGTAACEDWSDPQRNFGCPACGTFFLRQQRKRRLIEHIAQLHYLLASVTTLLVFLDRPYMGLHWLLLLMWVALAIWFAYWLDGALPARTQLIPVQAERNPPLN